MRIEKLRQSLPGCARVPLPKAVAVGDDATSTGVVLGELAAEVDDIFELYLFANRMANF